MVPSAFNGDLVDRREKRVTAGVGVLFEPLERRAVTVVDALVDRLDVRVTAGAGVLVESLERRAATAEDAA